MRITVFGASGYSGGHIATEALNRGIEVVGDAEAVVDDDGTDGVETPFVLLDPRGGALQTVGGAHVVHEEAVDGAHERLGVEVLGEQAGVLGGESAVAADVEVPPLVGGDDADVLAAGLGALTGAPGDAELDLVR